MEVKIRVMCQGAKHEGPKAQATALFQAGGWNVYISCTLESKKGQGKGHPTLHLRLFDLINHSSWSEEHCVQLDVEAA